jgi:hypothetical protein
VRRASLPNLLRAEWTSDSSIDSAVRAARHPWRCSTCGHKWSARLNERIATLARSARRKSSRTGCPGCHQIHRLGPIPERLVAEWAHPTLKIHEASRDWRDDAPSYPWRCAEGHEWFSTLYGRMTRKGGCHICRTTAANQGRNR